MRQDKIREEILRCGRDPIYFITKYVKISHPTRGLIPFTTFGYQDQLVRDYVKHRFNVILKARQLGISEVTAAFAAWMMLFHRQKNILVMATKGNTAKNIVKKVKTALRKVPKWLMIARVTTNNVMSVELDNGSAIKAITTSEDAGRSEALSLLILDEAAFVKNLTELWTGLFHTVSAGGRIIVLSTPNGVGNKFHELYSDGERGDNEFHPTKLMWWEHPERISDLEDDPNRPGFKTSTWYRNEIRATNMSPRDVAQELECNFNASGETVLSYDQLKWVEDGCVEPIEKEGVERNTWIWMPPVAGRRYHITADVARGDGKDFSAAHVWDSQSMEQVAEYYGKIPPDGFAALLADLGRRYNKALVVVENNNVGLVCLEHLRLLGYEAVYYSRKGDQKPGEVVNSFWGPATDDLVQGFTTSQKTRPLIIAKMEEYVRNEQVHIRSKRFHQELKTFIWNGGRPEAMRGSNDDLVMAGSIGVWMRDTFLASSLVSLDVTKKMIGAISATTTHISDIAGASKDPRVIHNMPMGVGGRVLPNQIRLPNGQVVDFGWLIPISKG